MNRPDPPPTPTLANDPDVAPPRLRSPRARFWLGFGIGFLLLLLFSCGGTFLLFGPENFSLANLQSGQGAWTPPTAAPTPDQPLNASSGPAAGSAADAALFSPGEQAQNVTNSQVNLRRSPGYQGKPADDALAQLRPDDRVEILGPSVTEDGLVWWQVRYQHPDGRVLEGWVAQATASGVTILAAVQP